MLPMVHTYILPLRHMAIYSNITHEYTDVPCSQHPLTCFLFGGRGGGCSGCYFTSVYFTEYKPKASPQKWGRPGNEANTADGAYSIPCTGPMRRCHKILATLEVHYEE